MKWHRLDRPSGALLGAVLMVILCGVLTLDEAYRAIDFNTILLLTGHDARYRLSQDCELF